jgi:uncharacterized protein YciI
LRLLAALAALATLLPATAASATDAPAAPAAPKPAAPAKEPPAGAMEKYYLVLLLRPNPPPPKLPDAEAEAMQARHLGHLQKMARSGKMVIAGPFDEQEDVFKRGLCLYKVDTAEEARRLASEDPIVQAGRLKVEVMAWYVEKGNLSFKAPEQPR